MNNFKEFLSYLMKKNILLQQNSILEIEGSIKIILPQIINNKNQDIYVIFDKNDYFVDIYCIDFLTINEKSIKDIMIFVNELNIEYRMLTFITHNNKISVKSSIIVDNNFSPNVVLMIVNTVNKIIERLQVPQ